MVLRPLSVFTSISKNIILPQKFQILPPNKMPLLLEQKIHHHRNIIDNIRKKQSNMSAYHTIRKQKSQNP